MPVRHLVLARLARFLVRAARQLLFARHGGSARQLFFVSSLTLAYLSSQATSTPASLLEDAPIVETATDEVPALSDEMPVSDDLPALEAAEDFVEDAVDLPVLEEEAAERSGVN